MCFKLTYCQDVCFSFWCLILSAFTRQSMNLRMKYRASQLVVDLGWIDLDMRVPTSGPTAQPHLPHSHQPGKSLADRGILKIQSTQPRSTTNCPVFRYLSACFCQLKEIWLHTIVTCRFLPSHAPQNNSRPRSRRRGGIGFLCHIYSLRPPKTLGICPVTKSLFAMEGILLKGNERGVSEKKFRHRKCHT